MTPVHHSRALPGNPGHHSRCRVRLPSAVMMAAKPQKTQRLHRNFPPFRHSLASLSLSVILGPCPGIQFLIANNRTGFPPSVRMTAGRAMVIPGVVRVFLFPSFSWPPRESSPGMCCIFFRRHPRALPRESSPKPHSGFPPSARMTAGRDVYFCELNGAGFPPNRLGDRTGLDSHLR